MMDSILFTGGASQDTASLIPLNLSRLRCKLFGSNDQGKRSSGPNVPRYSEKVQLGNWFERRVVYHPPPDEWITVYSTHYKPHNAKDCKADMFTIWKNKEKTQGTESKPVSDGDAYLNNMTSSYDLSYRIIPKDLCGPRIRVFNPRKNAWFPETELALSYGNQTKYGLVEAVKEEHRLAEIIPPRQSVYQVDYNEQPLTAQDFPGKRFPKPRGDMNTPDLRHLGIVLSPTTRPIACEPQYRSSRCEKICTMNKIV